MLILCFSQPLPAIVVMGLVAAASTGPERQYLGVVETSLALAMGFSTLLGGPLLIWKAKGMRWPVSLMAGASTLGCLYALLIWLLTHGV